MSPLQQEFRYFIIHPLIILHLTPALLFRHGFPIRLCLFPALQDIFYFGLEVFLGRRSLLPFVFVPILESFVCILAFTTRQIYGLRGLSLPFIERRRFGSVLGIFGRTGTIFRCGADNFYELLVSLF